MGSANAAGSAAATMMSQAMLTMMDIMGNLAQQYSSNRRWNSGYVPFEAMSGAPMAMYNMPGGIPGQQQMQSLSEGAQDGLPAIVNPAQTMGGMFPGTDQSPLDGIWQGQAGEIVLVMYGHFRIYADSDHYRDGRYEINDKLLVMHDPQSGNSRSYEYAFSEGRMVLRDKEGNLLLFRQLPIPIPSYSLISGKKIPSPQQQPSPNQ
jgi:hypothetical protein